MERYLCKTGDCTTCVEDPPDAQPNECRGSKESCGHHCNCSYQHETCCWCTWDPESAEVEGGPKGETAKEPDMIAAAARGDDMGDLQYGS